MNRGCILAGFLVSLVSLPLSSADDVEGLINKQKEEQEIWKDSEGDLPPALLSGFDSDALIYSPAFESSHNNVLCTDVVFDELLDPAQPERPSNVTIVNAKIPRIREALSDSCMIRPGDPLVAVGPGWQELVVVKDFVIRPEKLLCPNDPPFSLAVNFDGKFKEDPLFYSTDIELPAAPNDFKFIDQFPAETLDNKLARLLSKEIQFSDEYGATVHRVLSPNCDHLLIIKKKNVSPDDSDLPNEAIFTEKDGIMSALLIEKVDPVKGSGHMEIEGLFDFNGDKKTDLLIKGDHQGCPFRVLFRGVEKGFERMNLPSKACSC